MVLIRQARIRKAAAFLILVLCSCNRHTAGDDLEILWEKSFARGIAIPAGFARNVHPDSLRDYLSFHRHDDTLRRAILGDFEQAGRAIHFYPLIPLTPGTKYLLMIRGKSVAAIEIPTTAMPKAEVLAIYPSQDTVPENLLKMYIEFSVPMREGRSLQYISLRRVDGDTVENALLDLETELWNYDGTLLTVWLDPGRVKRDLQPNKRLGAPLEKNEHYVLSIEPRWEDRYGNPLKARFEKTFFVCDRDTIKPESAHWKIRQVPERNSRTPIVIELRDNLDLSLLREAIGVFDAAGKRIAGRIEVAEEESIVEFLPDQGWKSGSYTLRFEARLEDLAGNNLNRLFDRDVLREPSANESYYEKKFRLE